MEFQGVSNENLFPNRAKEYVAKGEQITLYEDLSLQLSAPPVWPAPWLPIL